MDGIYPDNDSYTALKNSSSCLFVLRIKIVFFNIDDRDKMKVKILDDSFTAVVLMMVMYFFCIQRTDSK